MGLEARNVGRLRVAGNCTGCGACVSACPSRALSLMSEQSAGRGRKTVRAAAHRCTGCGTCLPACPRQALTLATAGCKMIVRKF